jgi:hypothetical protein
LSKYIRQMGAPLQKPGSGSSTRIRRCNPERSRCVCAHDGEGRDDQDLAVQLEDAGGIKYIQPHAKARHQHQGGERCS